MLFVLRGFWTESGTVEGEEGRNTDPMYKGSSFTMLYLEKRAKNSKFLIVGK